MRSLDGYAIEDGDLLTPALVLYEEHLQHNLGRMLSIVGGAERWRPHVKTAKLAYTMRQLAARGVRRVKCATTLELQTACEAGATDVLVAFPVVGANAARVREIAERFAGVSVSVLIEQEAHLMAWRGSRVGVFVDLNSGMNRTGLELEQWRSAIELVRSAEAQGIRFRGLHYYDGHLSAYELPERTTIAHRGYDELMGLTAELDTEGMQVEELITSGTPALPCALSYEAFRSAHFRHTVSPGTVVYNDLTSLRQLPAEYDLRLAALLVSTVVSHPINAVVTCDAGHKSMPVDSGVPHCAILGREEIEPLKPSEEHLPLRIPPGTPTPEIGDRIYLVPRHVCPMINNFDDALIVREGKIVGSERVTARGHEASLRSVAAAQS